MSRFGHLPSIGWELPVLLLSLPSPAASPLFTLVLPPLLELLPVALLLLSLLSLAALLPSTPALPPALPLSVSSAFGVKPRFGCERLRPASTVGPRRPNDFSSCSI